MKSKYKYILAPNILNNFQVVQFIILQYPLLVEERRIKTAYRKSLDDVVGKEELLLAPADPQSFIYVKIDTTVISEQELQEILNSVEDVQVFDRENQPFNEYWI